MKKEKIIRDKAFDIYMKRCFRLLQYGKEKKDKLPLLIPQNELKRIVGTSRSYMVQDLFDAQDEAQIIRDYGNEDVQKIDIGNIFKGYVCGCSEAEIRALFLKDKP